MVQLVEQLRVIFGQVSPVYAKSSQPPARPPYPTSYPASQQPVPHGGMGMPQPPGYSSYPNMGYQSGAGHQNTPYPVSTTQYNMPRVNPNQGYNSGAVHSSPYPAGPTPYPTSNQSAGVPQSHLPSRQGSMIDEQTVRMSLLTTAEDKLKQRVREVFEMGRVRFFCFCFLLWP